MQKPFDYFRYYEKERPHEREKRIKGPIYDPNRELQLQILECLSTEDKIVPALTMIDSLGYNVKFHRNGRHFDIVRKRS